MSLISTREAGERLGVSDARIRGLILAGELKATKIGKVWIIDTKDLAALRRRKPGRPRKDRSDDV
ncbi:MAG: helix-turn-helix domain-containing protein [Planctomycetota bacterium]